MQCVESSCQDKSVLEGAASSPRGRDAEVVRLKQQVDEERYRAEAVEQAFEEASSMVESLEAEIVPMRADLEAKNKLLEETLRQSSQVSGKTLEAGPPALAHPIKCGKTYK